MREPYHVKTMKKVSEETGVDLKIVKIIMKHFFKGLRLCIKNFTVMTFPGLFKMRMRNNYYRWAVYNNKAKPLNNATSKL